jgi:hypothetical protein
MAYAVNSKTPAQIQKYLQHQLIRGITFDRAKKGFKTADGAVYHGLHSMLRLYHYPNYVHSSRRSRTQKKGSSKVQGARVDQQLFEYIKSDYNKKPSHKMAVEIALFLHEKNQVAVAAQLPVFIQKLQCITQADLIALDTKTDELWVYEVKTGYPAGGYRKKGELKGIPSVANTVYNHWELQRHYTVQGMEDNGLKVDHSAVLHVYMDTKKRKLVVNARKIPKWIKKWIQK